jgi:hypothetical protein
MHSCAAARLLLGMQLPWNRFLAAIASGPIYKVFLGSRHSSIINLPVRLDGEGAGVRGDLLRLRSGQSSRRRLMPGTSKHCAIGDPI